MHKMLRNNFSYFITIIIVSITLTSIHAATEVPDTSISGSLSKIHKIFNKPIYKNAQWGLRVIDTNDKKILIDLNSSKKFFIGSVRKIFSVGEFLNEVGSDYRFISTVHYDGNIRDGELKGNLILVASGDLTMGGRTNPDGTIAITEFDHNEANSLGNAQITKPDPLAGYKALAKQVKQFGINKISGEVIIDDRLFDPFNFRQEFNVSPIFVNDDVVDVIINPGQLNHKAVIKWRPSSAAFSVINNLITVNQGKKYTLELNPVIPECIGKVDCFGEVKNELPINFIPPLTNAFPLIQTFRISKPANYARIIFIEVLREAGVNVSVVKLIKENPSTLLKDKEFYHSSNQVASLKSLPYGDYAKYILKVSYNIGADTTLVLFGLTQGVRNMNDSLRIERDYLENKYQIAPTSFTFIDGSGGGDTMATNITVTKWLEAMTKSSSFNTFFKALPILAVDGSLGFVKNFQSNPSLKGAVGKVHAKTGTYLTEENHQLLVKGQSLAGYIITKKNHLLIFQLVVNNVAIHALDDLLAIFQDQGEVAALLWQNF